MSFENITSRECNDNGTKQLLPACHLHDGRGRAEGEVLHDGGAVGGLLEHRGVVVGVLDADVQLMEEGVPYI